jgi:hypothetical protein
MNAYTLENFNMFRCKRKYFLSLLIYSATVVGLKTPQEVLNYDLQSKGSSYFTFWM